MKNLSIVTFAAYCLGVTVLQACDSATPSRSTQTGNSQKVTSTAVPSKDATSEDAAAEGDSVKKTSDKKPKAPGVDNQEVVPPQSPAESTGPSEASEGAPSSEPIVPGSTPAPAPTDPTQTPPPPTPVPPAAFSLTSSAFANNGAIPALYVAKNGGGNQSPPIEWKNVPAGTGFFAIQMVDLDAGTPPLIHWMITNIPATSTKLPTAVPAGNNLTVPAEALGANQTQAYRGPNPPALHRYELTIYAIKAGQTLTLTTNSTTNKTELESKSAGKATLIGTYQ